MRHETKLSVKAGQMLDFYINHFRTNSYAQAFTLFHSKAFYPLHFYLYGLKRHINTLSALRLFKLSDRISDAYFQQNKTISDILVVVL